MKRRFTYFAFILILPLLFSASSPDGSKAPATDTYIVIGWNDLGMHCANKQQEFYEYMYPAAIQQSNCPGG